MNTDALFMHRALQLAALGQGSVSPNPMVGCVIVHQDRIIGEGWHRQYGQPHAEVNAVNNVEEKQLLSNATAYVTLEPCAHFGKTPPCADLLVRHQFKRVVVCNLDPNPLVAGKGIDKLRAAGIDVEIGLLEAEGRVLNRRFFTMMEQKRPYIILKFAQTADGFIAKPNFEAIQISGVLAKKQLHQWRTQEDAIMVGFNTALHDNPQLTSRLWPDRNPVRVAFDRNLQLPQSHQLFNQEAKTIIFNLQQQSDVGNVLGFFENLSVQQSINCLPHPKSLSSEERDLTLHVFDTTGGEVTTAIDKAPIFFEKIDFEDKFFSQVFTTLLQHKIQSVIVEGGTKLLQSFIDAGFYDEFRIFESKKVLNEGIAAPILPKGLSFKTEIMGDDILKTWVKP